MDHTEKQEGDVDVTHSDTSKAMKILGYRPKVDINQGLEKTYRWMLDHLSNKSR